MDSENVQYTTNDIMVFLIKRTKYVDNNLEDIKKGIQKNSNEVTKLKEELENVKRNSEENLKKNSEKIKDLEEALNKTEKRKDKEDLRRNVTEEEIDEKQDSPCQSEEEGEKPPHDTVREKEKCKTSRFKFNWAKQVADQLVQAANAAGKKDKEKMSEIRHKMNGQKVTVRDTEKEDTGKVKKVKAPGGMKALRRWFGEDTPENSSESEAEPSDDEDWDEKISRKERNRERKKRNLSNKKMRKETIATRAMRIIGLGPIEQKSIDIFMKDSKDYKEAKSRAVKEYLSFYLQFDEEDLDNVTILDTQASTKGDKIVYTAFENIETIKEIHWRAAAVKNDKIMIRNYIPPQFWNQYSFLSKACTDYRTRFPKVKTQMRFSSKDIEILMKERGTAEPYKQVAYRVVTNPEDIPEFDFSVKWHQKTDRPPRKTIRTFQIEDCPPSLREKEKSLVRLRSMEKTSTESKKQRQNWREDCEMSAGDKTQ